MSNQQQKDNSGALFPNQSENPKAPTHKGKVMVNGVALDIAGWRQKSQKGVDYISLKFSSPYKKEGDVDEAF
jgi:uncharacterized protein (DUF736 family)